MEKALWYLFVGTRGGENRVRIVRALDDRPQNANQLSEMLDVDYNTVRYHLDKLEEANVVEAGGNSYGELYFLTDQFETHEQTFEDISEHVE